MNTTHQSTDAVKYVYLYVILSKLY